MGFNCLKATATSRRQFTFYHSVPRNSWNSFYQPQKDRITRAFNRSGATLAVALDISKAFDRVWHAVLLHKLKACVCYCSLFLKDKCTSSLVWTKYIEKEFNLQLFFLPTVLWTFILSWATTRYLPPSNLFIKNNCMCNQDNACDIAACPDE